MLTKTRHGRGGLPPPRASPRGRPWGDVASDLAVRRERKREGAPRCAADETTGRSIARQTKGDIGNPTVNKVTARPRCVMLPCAKPRPQKRGERNLPTCVGDGRHLSRCESRVIDYQCNRYWDIQQSRTLCEL